MQFSKMHGIGNDYIFVNCFEQPAPDSPAELASLMSDRHFGIGSDGLILILPSKVADAKMLIWNADGSPAEMCGNGARCVAKYYHDHLEQKETIQIETPADIVSTTIGKTIQNSTNVSVNMGQPIWDSSKIPTTLTGNPLLDIPIQLGEKSYPGNINSVGNPHCVLFVDELTDSLIQNVGPAIERHSYFPERINVEFVQIINPSSLKMRIWERGSSETLACGTGACATFAVSHLKGFVNNEVSIDLPGGTLQVHYDNQKNMIMSGLATEVFSGIWNGIQDRTQTPHSPHTNNLWSPENKKRAA